MPNTFKNHQKIVIKIGSSSLTHPSGLLNLWKMEQLVKQIANLHNQEKSVIVVSSGAIAAGMGKLRMTHKPDAIEEKQAAAAVGQCTLMHMYEKFFAEYGISVAQILLSGEDIDSNTRSTHCKNALNALLNHRIVPIINENDAVAIDEIKVGDNDTLSARVCAFMDFDALILISDIHGVYDKDPNVYPDANKIPLIDSLEMLNQISAGDSSSKVGTGGMATKLNAARILQPHGKDLLIVNGQTDAVLNNVFSGLALGTLFRFSSSK